nr:immunoglobulin light chain junction region [Macaca mulatta]MOW52693.1 immunoglobulin light chain junction region [Macaca mulatta]MOW53066.1 immunoglobulin light chain junction region [Macaca mulatta]MOW54942.1 immunoglobulin light chain junction region [Macaca mulatta]MOW55228.1 immunoglobulin light chain junction region [Macaca mulatta]
CLQGYKTPYTF